MLCKKCGYSNDDSNKFCQECGAPMGDTAPETATESVNTNTDSGFVKTTEPEVEAAPEAPNPINSDSLNPNPVNPNPINPQNNGYNPNPVNPQGGFNPNMAGGNPNFNPNMPNGYPVFDPVAEKNAKDAENMALWSMICGIASFFCCGLVLGILSIVLGAMAKNKGSKSKKATAGIVLGIIGLVLMVVSFIFTFLSAAYGGSDYYMYY